MPVFDLFSKRRKRERGETPDVYFYDKIPEPLKVQIVHIWGDALGIPGRDHSSYNDIRETYQFVVRILRREYGQFALSKLTFDPNDVRYAYNELVEFFLKTNDIDTLLDIIEATFKAINVLTREYRYLERNNYDEVANEAIEELNKRFNEHGVGYRFSDNTIIRIDSELTHAEVMKPALSVLRQKGFESAQSEFLAAHQHYRQSNGSEALVECYKAFESVMKIIATKRGWKFDKAKGAADLVRVCLDNGLIPPYWQSHFSGLRGVLESAIPTPRNKQAGHGAGAAPPSKPPAELVGYVLHMTAATILFLTEAEKKLS
jgi:hypothetical protein